MRFASMGVRPKHPETVLSAITLALLTACGGGKPQQRGAPPPPEVSVVTVQPQSVPVTYEFSALVVPYRRVDVRSRVDGIILERPFDEGQIVKPGQVLYKIDPVRYDAAYRSAVARFQNAKQRLDRLKPLLAAHAVAELDVESAQSEYDAAQAAVVQARKDSSETLVRAEIEGRTGRTRLEVGARVTGPADVLTTIDRLNPVYVTFRPSSQQLLEWNSDPRSRSLIRPGSPLAIQALLPDSSVVPGKGRLDFVAPALDDATGTQEFRAVFQNEDRRLTPGEFVRARVLGITKQNALVVPIRAVQTALGRQFVYVVAAGDTVRAHDVDPGPWSGNQWIIDSGLVAGDRVIVDGTQKVAPGRTVHAVPLGDTAAAAAAPASQPAAPARPAQGAGADPVKKGGQKK
jgi:membrane fusion protein (multidrug efflux system)